MVLSTSGVNYLKIIYILKKRSRLVRSIDIAQYISDKGGLGIW